MQCVSSWRHQAQLLITVLLCSGCTSLAWADIYNPLNKQLTISSAVIGFSTYSNMVVTVGNIVSGPSPTGMQVPANGGEDSYDPASNQLTVPTVSVGSATFRNVIVTVAHLVSIGSVSFADSYNSENGELRISSVWVGGTAYSNVVIRASASDVVSVGGGLPTVTGDSYNTSTGQLTIAAIQLGGNVYTNVVLNVGIGNIVSIGRGETYTVSGKITGLYRNGLRLANDGIDVSGASAGATSFTFNTKLPSGAAYNVLVVREPIAQVGTFQYQSCAVTANGSGNVGASDISNVEVTCN
jgi:hypothetical protein